LNATETLRNDHKQIKRLEKVISKCYQALYDGKDIPFSDIEKITIIPCSQAISPQLHCSGSLKNASPHY